MTVLPSLATGKLDLRIQCQASRIEPPRLLLSGSSMFKGGLANGSGPVGRNYMRHTTGSVYAVLDKLRAHGARTLRLHGRLCQDSRFTSSAAENPTLTIVSLAIRQAQTIADRMSRREP